MRLVIRLLVVTLLGTLGARPASAALITYNLTGTWTGSLKCNNFDAGAKQKTVLTPVMRITQIGLDLGVQLDFGTGTSRYGGLANADAKKPEEKGEAALILCGTDNVLGVDFSDEIARMTVSTKPGKVKATFKGVSIFSKPTDPFAHHGTCKWKWTRTDTVDPNLLTQCDQVVVALPPTPAALGGGAR